MIPNPALIIDLGELFKKQFSTRPYVINDTPVVQPKSDARVTVTAPGFTEFTKNGSLLREQYLGIEIFLPIKIFDESGKTL